MSFSWICPYCNQHATITDEQYSVNYHYFNNNNKDGWLAVRTVGIVCPNHSCKEYVLSATLHKRINNYYGVKDSKDYSTEALLSWQLKPSSHALQFPTFIPKAIIADYEEACLIRDLSPKASATLSRRCLQGIIRDFWKVKKGRLIDEIHAIKEKVDPITWQAIDSVRSIGNIGAHMEKDIDLIIDVEPEEAQLLIGLIEILIKDWYIAKHERQKHLDSIIGVAKEKKDLKTNKDS